MAKTLAMHGGERPSRADRGREPRPLDAAQLQALALAYVARYATSGARLERYLIRKLRDRGWIGEAEADPRALVERFAALGYVDDAAFARARSGSLLRRGYGPRRIGQTLGAAGISPEIRDEVGPDESARRAAALAMVRKRRFGPFCLGPLAPPKREKQIAAMLRAGHILADVRALIGAQTIDAAEEWAAACEE